MLTPSAFREAIVIGRAELQAAFHDAHSVWDLKAESGLGEEAWCPREIAEHVLGAEWVFTGAIAQACSSPLLQRQRPDLPTPSAAAVALTFSGATTDFIVRLVNQADLARICELRMGELSVGHVMQLIGGHAHEHALQIRACVR